MSTNISTNTSVEQSQPLQPTKVSERITVIDALRGFAIFGILVVNMFYFFNPWFVSSLEAGASAANRAALFGINFLFVSKFYTLFSFLFGLGMFIQMSRSEAKGTRFVPLYLRRLLILAVLGFAHGVLLWTGDILLLYAGAGLLLLFLFRNRGPRTLLIWAIVLIALPVLFIGVGTFGIEMARQAPDPEIYAGIEAGFTEAAEQLEVDAARDYNVYANGSYAAVTAERFRDFGQLLLTLSWFSTPSILAMFLLGLRAGKRGWFTDMGSHIRSFRRLLLWALPLGLALNFYVASTGFSQSSFGATPFTWQTFLQLAALNIGSVLLSLSYVALIVLFSRTANGQRILAPLAPVGRMALSNYLLHSIVMTTLSYGYGLGLYGSISLATGFTMAIVLYALQIPLSRWWLNRFRFGPFEWLWRSLTYARPQPMRRVQQPAEAQAT